MELTTFVRKPFTVEAVLITEDNIAEIAKIVGTLKKTEDDKPFIQVDRRKVPNVYKVHPGFWMTKMGDNIRCYSGHIFTAQFLKTTPEIEELISVIDAGSENKPAELTTN